MVDLYSVYKYDFAVSFWTNQLVVPDNISITMVLSALCGTELSLHDSTVPLCSRRTLLIVAVDTITVPLMFVRFTVNISNSWSGW